MLHCIVAVAVFLLTLVLVNVIFLHSHIHSYSSHFNLVSQSVVRTAPTGAVVSIQSLLETNNATSLSKEDLEACPGLPRTACFETTYTILAVCSEDRLPILVQKVLQWMHDPFVHQIYLLFPSSVRTSLGEDPHYGARLLHWEDQHSIKLVSADSLANALQSVNISTGALVWVPETQGIVPNQMIREAFGRWKSDASRSIAISNLITRQWFLLHRNWLCVLRSITNQTSDTWDTTPLHEVFSLLAAVPHESSSPKVC